MLQAFIAGAIGVFISMTITWLIQLRSKNAGIVDVTWTYNFILIVFLFFIFSQGLPDRKTLLASLVFIWAGRLGTYLYVRNVGKEEDVRYTKLREDWGASANLRMLFFFYFQGIFNLILSIPFLLILQEDKDGLHFLEIFGAVVVILAVIGEGLADWQLKRFKKNPANKGKVCDRGLWYYSRHPNYFFEWLVWVGFFIIALPCSYGWIAIVSPILILWTLLKMTGIPMTEELAVKRKGDAYREYQRTTSSFIPLPKRK